MSAGNGFAEQIREYDPVDKTEAAFKAKFLALLQHPDAFQRTHLPGHITGSSFIVSGDFKHTLLVHHAKLNRWLQPGGHADGDTNVAGVALREANEETGVKNIVGLKSDIFDLDIHIIPARKDFPQHEHYDVRYLFRASMTEQIVVSEESHDVKWVALGDLESYNNEPALLRMREKFGAMKLPPFK
jgi:8-oxo-dGTP pyrophosphatase MutT (NUDIX family)